MTMQAGDWYPSGSSPAPSAYLQWVDASGNANACNFDVVLSEDWTEGATITEHAVEIGADIADHVRVNLVKCELKVFASNEPIGTANSGPTPFVTQPNNAATRGALSLPIPTVGWTASSLTLTYPTWSNPILERAVLQEAAGGIGGAVGGTTGSLVGAVAGGLLGALLLSAHEVDVTQGTSAGLQPPANAPPTFDVDQWANVTDYVAAMHGLLVALKNAAQSFTVMGTKQQLYPMVIEDLAFHRDNATGSGEQITISLKEVRIVTTATVPLPIPNLAAGGGKPTVSKGGQDPTPAPVSLASQGFTKAAALLSGAAKSLSGAVP